MGCFHFLKQSNHITSFKVCNSTLEGNPPVLYYNNTSLSRRDHNMLWLFRNFNNYYTIYSNYLIIFYNYISFESMAQRMVLCVLLYKPFNDPSYLLTKGLPGCAFGIKIGHLFQNRQASKEACSRNLSRFVDR